MPTESYTLPCPYQCEMGVHPKGTLFCPIYGKPMDIPIPSSKNDSPATIELKPAPIPTNAIHTISPSMDALGEHEIPTIPPKEINKRPVLNMLFFLKELALLKSDRTIKILTIILAFLLGTIIVLHLLSTKDSNSKTMVISLIKKNNKIENTPSPLKKSHPNPLIAQSFTDLPEDIKNEYLNQLKKLNWSRISVFKRDQFDLQGALKVKLAINEMGKISVQEFSHLPVKTTPPQQLSNTRNLLNQQLAKMARKMDLIPILDKNSQHLSVIDLPWTIQIQESIKTTPFITLPTQIRLKVEDQLERLKELPTGYNLELAGKIEFLFTLDENGVPMIQKNMDADSIEVIPYDKKISVIKTITHQIESYRFQPIQDESGVLLKIIDIPLSVIPRPVVDKEFKDLSSSAISACYNQLEQLGEIPLDEPCMVKGQIWLKLHIDQLGRVLIQSIDTDLLRVSEPASMKMIVHSVKNKLQSRTIIPVQEKNGTFLRISNFLLILNAYSEQGQLKIETLREL